MLSLCHHIEANDHFWSSPALNMLVYQCETLIRGTKLYLFRSGVAMHQRYNESTANLKELMTVAPINPEVHAALLRGKVDTRRLLEDAREEARQRSEEVL
jgi:hypothetical protein